MKKIIGAIITTTVLILLYIYWGKYISNTNKWWDQLLPKSWTWYENTWTIIKWWDISWIPIS